MIIVAFDDPIPASPRHMKRVSEASSRSRSPEPRDKNPYHTKGGVPS